MSNNDINKLKKKISDESVIRADKDAICRIKIADESIIRAEEDSKLSIEISKLNSDNAKENKKLYLKILELENIILGNNSSLKPEPKPELKLEPKPELKPELKPEPKPEPKPELKPEPKPELKLEPKPKHKPVDLLNFEVWKREKGYWFGEYTFLNSVGNSDYKATDDSTGGQYNYKKYYGFINLQVMGDKLKQRNIFIRPALNLEKKDLDKDGVVSINELNSFGFTSPYDYSINLDTKIATPMVDKSVANVTPFKYTEGTEKTFTADQNASDNLGNLTGSYFGIPTSTKIIGNDTVLYRVGDDKMLYQNQLTSLPGNNTRVRTAQGFFNGASTYSSYYRETKFEDDLDKKGNIIKSARDKFFEKLNEYRDIYNVPIKNRTKNIEDFFKTGLEMLNVNEDYKLNKNKWNNHEIRNYSFTFNWSCFCSQEYIKLVNIKVINNKIFDIVDVESQKTINKDMFNNYKTIDQLFDFILNEYENSDSVNVKYNEKFGYPTNGSFDRIKLAIDDEMAFNISDFKIDNSFIVIENNRYKQIENKIEITTFSITRDYPPSVIQLEYKDCKMRYQIVRNPSENSFGYYYNGNLYRPTNKRMLRYSKSGIVTMDYIPCRISIIIDRITIE